MVARKSFFISLLFAAAAMQATACAITGDVFLISPENGSWTNTQNESLFFSFSYTDAQYATADCTLNISSYSKVGIISVSGVTMEERSGLAFDNGENVWNVSCRNNTVNISTNWVFFFDDTVPTVNLLGPPDEATLEAGTIGFEFNYTDAFSRQASCRLFVNGSARYNGDVDNNENSTFTAEISQDGEYRWNINCTDEAGNEGASETRTLNVVTPLSIEIVYPEEKEYMRLTSIPLEINIKGTPVWIGYSLDGAANVTISGNTTFDVSAEGGHLIEVYANDSAGSMKYDNASFTAVFVPEVAFIAPEGVYSTGTVLVNLSTEAAMEWCVVSLNGGSNISLENDSTRTFWSRTLTGLSEQTHDIEAWCNYSGELLRNDTEFSVVISSLSILIEEPENRSYWNVSSVDVLAKLSKDAEECRLYLGGVDGLLMGNISKRIWTYTLQITSGVQEVVIVRCVDQYDIANSTSVVFTAYNEECTGDEEGLCKGYQNCTDNKCVDLSCPGCTYAENHTCVSYECCENKDCLESQECVSNRCTDIDCPCGAKKDHKCVKYECCENFDCDHGMECDTNSHTCVEKEMTLFVPRYIFTGQEVEITVSDFDGDPLEGVEVKIEYPSGKNETLKTDEEGVVKLIAKETGKIYIKASLPGYETITEESDVAAPFNWVIVVAVIAALGSGGAVYFYWSHLPKLKLKKVVNGQNVTLAVKNRSGEAIQNIAIMDTVPAGAFISCGVMPRMDNVGSESHLTWSANLKPGEEIVINYQASQSSPKFFVRAGKDDYESR